MIYVIYNPRYVDCNHIVVIISNFTTLQSKCILLKFPIIALSKEEIVIQKSGLGEVMQFLSP